MDLFLTCRQCRESITQLIRTDHDYIDALVQARVLGPLAKGRVCIASEPYLLGAGISLSRYRRRATGRAFAETGALLEHDDALAATAGNLIRDRHPHDSAAAYGDIGFFSSHAQIVCSGINPGRPMSRVQSRGPQPRRDLALRL